VSPAPHTPAAAPAVPRGCAAGQPGLTGTPAPAAHTNAVIHMPCSLSYMRLAGQHRAVHLLSEDNAASPAHSSMLLAQKYCTKGLDKQSIFLDYLGELGSQAVLPFNCSTSVTRRPPPNPPGRTCSASRSLPCCSSTQPRQGFSGWYWRGGSV
jgi:hypothetical protein